MGYDTVIIQPILTLGKQHYVAFKLFTALRVSRKRM